MIDFACKKIELNDVIRCSFDLTKSDLKIMFFLFNNSSLTSSEISSELSLDLSTIQRSLKRLYKKDIVRRNQKNLEKGGYVYEYEINSKNEIKNRIINIIEDWKDNVEKELKKI
ncbi:MAG: winged helix-turn-helix transcriptional regulator [Nanoarchaeota archaeon]